MKLLFLRFSSIGDIILTTPAIRAAKEQIEDVEIHFATKEKYAGILEPNPHIFKVHRLKDSIGDLILGLREEKFDAIIDLHKNLRTLRIKKALGIPFRSFDKINIEKWLMVNFKWNKLPKKHIVERYMDCLQSLNVKNDDKGLEFYIEEKDRFPRENLDPALREGYYAFAIGAQHMTKILPLEKMLSLCQKSTKPIALLGDENDSGRAEAIIRDLEEKRGINSPVNYCGTLSLGQTAEVIKYSDGVFCHDSGLMHIAAAFKKPIISFWGNTIPQFGMSPYRSAHKIIENKDLSCRPCTKIGFSKCPRGHFKCMKELNMEFNFQDLDL
jgi:ADP-heptose:LPS heptosyltransferase